MAQHESGVMPAARRQRLLATAASEFGTVGYQQASLNRIIRACGMSKSSFYHYVESKQQLFELVVEDLGGQLVDALDVPAPKEFGHGDFWLRTEALLDRLVALAEREPLFTDLGRMFWLPGAPSGAGSAVHRAMEAAERWLRLTLAAGRRSGAVREDVPAELQCRLTIAVLRALDEWTLRQRDGLTTRKRRQLGEIHLGTLVRLLAPDAPPQTPDP